MSNRGKNSGRSAESSKKNAQADQDQKQQNNERQAQMVLAVVGFAAFGLLVGVLWGANHMIAQVNEASPLCQAVKVGELIATNTADWGRGGIMGVLGLFIGGAFGYWLLCLRK